MVQKVVEDPKKANQKPPFIPSLGKDGKAGELVKSGPSSSLSILEGHSSTSLVVPQQIEEDHVEDRFIMSGEAKGKASL